MVLVARDEVLRSDISLLRRRRTPRITESEDIFFTPVHLVDVLIHLDGFVKGYFDFHSSCTGHSLLAPQDHQLLNFFLA